MWLRHPLNLNGKQVSIMANDAACVIADPEEIDRLFDQAHVLVRPIGPGLTENLTHLFRVVAEENWIKILAVHVGIGAPRRLQILRRLRRRVLRLQVDRDSNLSLFRGAGGPESLDSRAVRAHEVVRRDGGLEGIGVTRSENTVQISAVGYDPRLVERGPHLDAVTQSVPPCRRVARQPLGDVAIEPAAAVVERFGEVPVVEGRVRSDLRLEQLVDESRIEIDPFPVDLTSTVGEDTPPRDAEAISVETELGHDRDIVLVAPVVVAGDVAGLVEKSVVGCVGEAVPDAAAGAVGGGRSFDLISGSGCSPEEILGEAVLVGHSVGREAGSWRV